MEKTVGLTIINGFAPTLSSSPLGSSASSPFITIVSCGDNGSIDDIEIQDENGDALSYMPGTTMVFVRDSYPRIQGMDYTEVQNEDGTYTKIRPVANRPFSNGDVVCIYYDLSM
jgi:hypothetical protein